MARLMLLVATVLLELAVRADAADGTLFYAARDGNVVALRRVLEDGLPPDTLHESGLTALMWAATTGHAGTITALLEAG